MQPDLTIQRVLLATDLSPVCESAFRYAAHVVNHFKARLYLLHVVPGKDGIQHWVHQGNIAGDHHRLDMVYDGVETLYVEMSDGSTYDRDGQKLTDGADGFAASDCHWTSDRKRAARAGDVVTLHALLSRDRYDEKRQPCDGERPVGAERAKRIDALLSSVRAVRAQSPEFVRALALGDRILDPENPTRENSESAESSESSTSAEDRATNEDLAKVLAANMTWYVEWPHVDGRFISLFRTLPGYATRDPGSSSD